jgi:hypothetical protein
MSDDMVWVYVEDDRALGPAAYRARAMPPDRVVDPVLYSGRMALPEEQVQKWEQALEAWEAAQAEMRSLLKARRSEVVEAIGDFAGFQAASRADRRGGRR